MLINLQKTKKTSKKQDRITSLSLVQLYQKGFMQDIPNRSKRDLRGTCDSLQMNENEIKVIAAKYR